MGILHAFKGTFFITWHSVQYLLIGTHSIWYADSFVINCINAIIINFGARDINSDNLQLMKNILDHFPTGYNFIFKVLILLFIYIFSLYMYITQGIYFAIKFDHNLNNLTLNVENASDAISNVDTST